MGEGVEGGGRLGGRSRAMTPPHGDRPSFSCLPDPRSTSRRGSPLASAEWEMGGGGGSMKAVRRGGGSAGGDGGCGGDHTHGTFFFFFLTGGGAAGAAAAASIEASAGKH